MTEKTAIKQPSGSAQPEQGDSIRGQDIKQARGLSQNAGHSPNEAGTDQRVEDAKRERRNKQ